MKEIISILILFGLTSLFEYIKQMRKKRAESQRAESPSPRRPEPVAMAAMAVPAAFRMRPVHPAPERQYHETKSSEEAPKDKNRSFLPGEAVAMSAPVADETPIEIVDLDAAPAVETGDAGSPAARHYERWRRAIIDAEILSPKF